MKRRVAAAALVGIFGSGAAIAAFHPVEDKPYICDMDETRTSDGVARHFHARRTIVFHRTADGYDATVTLVVIDHSASGDVATMFDAATGALRGHALHFRLDPGGHILGVDDADAAIGLIADAIARVGSAVPGRPPRLAATRALGEPLRTAPPAQKAAMLISVLRPLLAPDLAERAAGERTVMVPGLPPLPPGTPLAGVETVTRTDGAIMIDTRASGSVTLPTAAPGSAVAAHMALPSVRLRRTHTIDTATGLLRDSHESTDMTIPGEPGPRHALVETTIHLQPPAV